MTIAAVLIGTALIFNFLNGFNDAANIVATIISSRSLSPRKALILATVAEFIGPFVFGVAVAKTIGQGIVPPSMMTPHLILAALLSAIIWGLTTWFFRIPSSASHALIGGMLGSVAAGAGLNTIHLEGITKVLIALFTAPVLGLVVGFLLTKIVYFLARDASMRINQLFKQGQIFTSFILALSYGGNDAQKSIGIITLSLLITGMIPEFYVPVWVIVISGLSWSFGSWIGGWRIVRTLGGKFYKIRPVDGFNTQLTSAAVVLTAALLGGPVSTSQVVSSSILGVGSAERINKVRWGVAVNILIAWAITIPATFVLAVGIDWLIGRFY